MEIILYSVPAIAILGLVYMAIQAAWVRKQDAGTPRMAEIAQHKIIMKIDPKWVKIK